MSKGEGGFFSARIFEIHYRYDISEGHYLILTDFCTEVVDPKESVALIITFSFLTEVLTLEVPTYLSLPKFRVTLLSIVVLALIDAVASEI